MAQHDFNIGNQLFPNFRADLNDALSALATMSAGPTAPTTTWPNQLWYDTVNARVNMRGPGNGSWIPLFDIENTMAVTRGRANFTDGSAANPSVMFGGAAGTGVFRTAAGFVGVAADKTQVAQFAKTQVRFYAPVYADEGVTTPAQFLAGNDDPLNKPHFSFPADLKTGYARMAAGVLGLIVAGANKLRVSATEASFFTDQLQVPPGTAAKPGLSFVGADNVGFRRAASTIYVTVGGVDVMAFNANGAVTPTGKKFSGDGSGLVSLDPVAVATALAERPAGAVGVPAFLRNNTGASVSFNQTLAGSHLSRAHSSGNDGVTLSGTWRCLGYCPQGTVSLFVRV